MLRQQNLWRIYQIFGMYLFTEQMLTTFYFHGMPPIVGVLAHLWFLFSGEKQTKINKNLKEKITSGAICD